MQAAINTSKNNQTTIKKIVDNMPDTKHDTNFWNLAYNLFAITILSKNIFLIINK